jgi:hypothetical protein
MSHFQKHILTKQVLNIQKRTQTNYDACRITFMVIDRTIITNAAPK